MGGYLTPDLATSVASCPTTDWQLQLQAPEKAKCNEKIFKGSLVIDLSFGTQKSP